MKSCTLRWVRETILLFLASSTTNQFRNRHTSTCHCPSSPPGLLRMVPGLNCLWPLFSIQMYQIFRIVGFLTFLTSTFCLILYTFHKVSGCGSGQDLNHLLDQRCYLFHGWTNSKEERRLIIHLSSEGLKPASNLKFSVNAVCFLRTTSLSPQCMDFS